MVEENEKSLNLKEPNEAKLGDYVSLEKLFLGGGIFYESGGTSKCDMPTMTFELENATDAGFKRIE